MFSNRDSPHRLIDLSIFLYDEPIDCLLDDLTNLYLHVLGTYWRLYLFFLIVPLVTRPNDWVERYFLTIIQNPKICLLMDSSGERRWRFSSCTLFF